MSPTQTPTPIKDLLRIICKRRRFIICFNLGVLLAAAIGLLLLKPQYAATSQLLFRVGREHIADFTLPTGGAIRPAVMFNTETQANLIIEMLTGQQMLERIAEIIGPTKIYRDLSPDTPIFGSLFGKQPSEINLVQPAAEKLANNLVANHSEGSFLISVAFLHPEPEIAEDVLTTLLDQYIDYYVSLHKNSQFSMFFEDRFESLKKQLDESQRELENFRNKNGITLSIDEEQKRLLDLRSGLEAELHVSLRNEAETTKRITELRSLLAGTSFKDNVEFATHSERLAELRLRESEFRSKYKKGNPLLTEIQEQIRSVTAELKNLSKNEGIEKSGLGDRDTYSTLQEELLTNKVNLTAIQTRKQQLNTQVASYDQALWKLKVIEPELQSLEDRVKRNQEQYNLYRTQFEESNLSKEMDAQKLASVSIVQPVRTSLEPTKPKSLLLLICTFLGLLISLILAIFYENFRGRLETKAEIERVLGLPVLGVVPELPFEGNR